MSINSGYRPLTRDRFLFREMRTIAKLLRDGMSSAEVKALARTTNLFYYPSLSSATKNAYLCLRRLDCLGSPELVDAIADKAPDTAKMVALYAVMKQSRMVGDFMVSTIGEKYRTMDYAFSRADIKTFLMRLQEQDDRVASWAPATIHGTETALLSILVETEYLESAKATKLSSVWLPTFLRQAIIDNNDAYMLPAFNYF